MAHSQLTLFPLDLQSKICFKCREAKPHSEFAKRLSAKDGRASYCKDCHREYYRQWKKDNPEKVKANQVRYYHRNKDKVLARGKVWREENKERHQAMIKDWERRNPDKVKAKKKRYIERHPEKVQEWIDMRRESGRGRLQNYRRRKREAQNTPRGYEFTLDAIEGRIQFHGWRCYYCGKELDRSTVQMDHRIPICRGGANCASNLVPSCGPCNLEKYKMTEKEYWEYLDGLGG